MFGPKVNKIEPAVVSCQVPLQICFIIEIDPEKELVKLDFINAIYSDRNRYSLLSKNFV